MKTRGWLLLSAFALFPSLLSTMVCALISVEWLFGGEGKLGKMFLTGEFNRPFTSIMFLVGMFSLSIVFTTVLLLLRHSSKIDKLDEAISEAYEEKQKFMLASKKLADVVAGYSKSVDIE